MTVWMDSGWSDSPDASVSVKESVKILRSVLREALLTALEKRQSEALSETHQDLLLYSNQNVYWEDWSDGLSSSEKSLRN